MSRAQRYKSLLTEKDSEQTIFRYITGLTLIFLKYAGTYRIF